MQLEFLEAAFNNLRQAREVLAGHPELAEADFYSALVFGNVQRVTKDLKESPEKAMAKGGPLKCEPLIYVCF